MVEVTPEKREFEFPRMSSVSIKLEVLGFKFQDLGCCLPPSPEAMADRAALDRINRIFQNYLGCALRGWTGLTGLFAGLNRIFLGLIVQIGLMGLIGPMNTKLLEFRI